MEADVAVEVLGVVAPGLVETELGEPDPVRHVVASKSLPRLGADPGSPGPVPAPLARFAAPLVLAQQLLSQPDAGGGDLDQLVVVDELEGLLE